jgi:hypothetical protein
MADSVVKKASSSKKVVKKPKAAADMESRGKTAATTIQELKKKLATLGAEFDAKFAGVELK